MLSSAFICRNTCGATPSLFSNPRAQQLLKAQQPLPLQVPNGKTADRHPVQLATLILRCARPRIETWAVVRFLKTAASCLGGGKLALLRGLWHALFPLPCRIMDRCA